MMKRYYTNKQYKELLSHLVILCQTNEQVNDHILEYFDAHGIKYRQRAISEGDYGFMMDAAPELGFTVDTWFTDEVFIERKNSLQELAQSLYGQKKSRSNGRTEYDDAFRRELKRAINKKHKYLLVEQSNGLDGILNHDYPNHYSVESFWGTVHRMEIDYNLKIKFISRENMALAIYTICKFVLDSEIKKGSD